MQPKTPKLLEDVRQAATFILRKTAGKTLEDYLADDLLRPAVERYFEIIGESLTRLLREDEALALRITDCRRIIAFRNVLIHGYDVLDDRRIWDAVQHSLPALLAEVEALLDSHRTPP